METYPEVRLDLDFDDRLVDVVEEGFDAVLRLGQPGDSRLHAVREPLADGRLRPVLADAVRDCGTFHLLWPSGRHMLPKLRAFVDFLSERLPAAGLSG